MTIVTWTVVRIVRGWQNSGMTRTWDMTAF